MKLAQKARNILLACFLLSPCAARAADAGGKAPQAAPAVRKVTVTFYGNTASAKGFTWYTSAASTASDLQIAEKTGAAPDFSRAARFAGKYSHAANSPELVHKAEASGLKPGTAYYFRAGDSGLNAWSETGTFQTAAAAGPFTFMDLADPQAKSEDECILSAATIAKAYGAVPDAKFLAINGDIVDAGNKEKQWDWLLGHSEANLLNTTVLPVAGNHEEQKNAFISHFDIAAASGSSTNTGAYYSVDYGNAHFIVLNTNEKSSEYADLTPRQVEWLKSDAAARPAGAWLIVLLHKGPYSTSGHATDADIAGPNGMRAKAAPLLARLGADLVLQGHDHIYARTKHIKEDGTAGDAGPVYLIPATAGPKTYYRNPMLPPGYEALFAVDGENHAAAYGPDLKDPRRPMRGQIQNFTAITIDGPTLTAVSYEIDQSSNSARPYIIDRFALSKDGGK